MEEIFTYICWKSQTNSMSALFQATASHPTGSEPLPEPVMTRYIDACMRR